jgi:hypothetical protein
VANCLARNRPQLRHFEGALFDQHSNILDEKKNPKKFAHAIGIIR